MKVIRNILAGFLFLAAGNIHAQTQEFIDLKADIEAGDAESVRYAILQLAEYPNENSPLFTAEQPYLVLWLAPILLNEEFSSTEPSVFSVHQREVFAKLLLSVVSRSAVFADDARTWAANRLQAESSHLGPARELLLYNLSGLQEPGLPVLTAPEHE